MNNSSMRVTVWANIRAACEAVVDIILPRRARRMRAEFLAPGDLPLAPETRELLGVRITTLASYKEPSIEDAIRALKYDDSRRAASLAAALLADYLPEELEDIRRWWNRDILIAPVPLHPARERDRGFNQAARVVQSLPREFQDGTFSHLALHALARVRDTPPQTRLSRRERTQNVAGAFLADPSVANTHVIVIDDVATTGATLAEATRALEAAGASVTPIALARA